MKAPNRNCLLSAIVQAARDSMRQISEAEQAAATAATRMTRGARDLHDEIAKAPDLKRLERKLDIVIERRSFQESNPA